MLTSDSTLYRETTKTVVQLRDVAGGHSGESEAVFPVLGVLGRVVSRMVVSRVRVLRRVGGHLPTIAS